MSAPPLFGGLYQPPRGLVPPGIVYQVYPGGQWPTIQSAIDQAVSDGHTAQDNNPAYVWIYPTGTMAGYVENLMLSPGVNLIGFGTAEYSVFLNGRIRYMPPAGTIGPNTVHVEGLWIQAPAGINSVELTGLNVGRIFLRQCVVNKLGPGPAANIEISGAATSELHVTDCIGNGAGGALMWNAVSGRLFATRCDISPGTRSVHVAGGATAVFVQCNLQASGADVALVDAGGFVTVSDCLINQVTAAMAGITVNGVATVIQSSYGVPASLNYAALGAGTLAHGGNVFLANNRYRTTLTLVPLAVTPALVP
jgi:hypothetical protein